MLLNDALNETTPRRETELAELWAASFDAPAMTHMWRLDPERGQHTFVELAEDRIVGAVVVVPARIVTGSGDEVDIVGIGNVATHPEHRGKGIAARLMSEAAEWATGSGATWGVLFTDTPGVYSRQGWRGFTMHHLVGTLPAQRPEGAGRKAPDGFPFASLADLHREAYRESPLTARRDPWLWERAAAWYGDAELWLSGPDEEPGAYLVLRRDDERVRLWEAAGSIERVVDLVLAALAEEPAGRAIEARFADVATLHSALGRHLTDPRVEGDTTGMVKPLAGPGHRWKDIAHHPRAQHLYGDYY